MGGAPLHRAVTEGQGILTPLQITVIFGHFQIRWTPPH